MYGRVNYVTFKKDKLDLVATMWPDGVAPRAARSQH